MAKGKDVIGIVILECTNCARTNVNKHKQSPAGTRQGQTLGSSQFLCREGNFAFLGRLTMLLSIHGSLLGLIFGDPMISAIRKQNNFAKH